jgi:4-hydroxybutyrate CoA-transferase
MVTPTTASDAIKLLDRARRVFVTSGCGEPQTLVEALVASGRQAPLSITTGLQGGSAPYLAPPDDGTDWPFSARLFMSSREGSRAIAAGRGEYVPACLSQIADLLAAGPNAVDAALVQVGPPDAEGRCSLGPTVSYTKAAIRSAPLVIAEMNVRMPRTCGDSQVSSADLDVIVESDRQLIQVPQPEPDATSSAIARHVASLIRDGDCLQVGVSAIATAIWRTLAVRSDLGIHAGSVADGAAEAMRRGVVTNAAKSVDRGCTVTNQLIGTDLLYAFADGNPQVRLMPAEYSNDPRVIGGLRNFVSVNSALEVDLAGQVNSEVAGGRYLAGVGGALDFAIGARLSPGGRSVIALPSTARGRSRIVASTSGGNVTIPGTLVDFVVTEHGAADLRGASAPERARRLIELAAPEYRGDLADRCAQKGRTS